MDDMSEPHSQWAWYCVNLCLSAFSFFPLSCFHIFLALKQCPNVDSIQLSLNRSTRMFHAPPTEGGPSEWNAVFIPSLVANVTRRLIRPNKAPVNLVQCSIDVIDPSIETPSGLVSDIPGSRSLYTAFPCRHFQLP